MIDLTKDFKILNQKVNDEPLVYLDNAATTQKPQQVLDVLTNYYEHDNANVHRGVHTLAERATADYEAAREKVRKFIHAASTKEVLFTRGTTTSLNWVSKFAEQTLTAGDEIIISVAEHHSNFVPWQQVAEKTGAILKIVYLKDGALDVDDLKEKLTTRTKFVSLTHASNVLGSITPIKEIAELVHHHGAYFVVDGAQSVPHMKINVQELDVDFFAFSGHKMCGPTGVGILYGKQALLDAMPPYMGGGDMIRRVTLEKSTWNDLPYKFEAGTPAIAEGIGLGTAVDYLTALGMENIHAHEQKITSYALEALSDVPGLTV
ncbi:MAG: aminotransferase class V-fold PLP-dependent enzyme, partial [Lactococcus sp.]|nr:aminotransferase class V-fold PLP-dependent enzyme [Lactococcus sp.]